MHTGTNQKETTHECAIACVSLRHLVVLLTWLFLSQHRHCFCSRLRFFCALSLVFGKFALLIDFGNGMWARFVCAMRTGKYLFRNIVNGPRQPNGSQAFWMVKATTTFILGFYFKPNVEHFKNAKANRANKMGSIEFMSSLILVISNLVPFFKPHFDGTHRLDSFGTIVFWCVTASPLLLTTQPKLTAVHHGWMTEWILITHE